MSLTWVEPWHQLQAKQLSSWGLSGFKWISQNRGGPTYLCQGGVSTKAPCLKDSVSIWFKGKTSIKRYKSPSMVKRVVMSWQHCKTRLKIRLGVACSFADSIGSLGYIRKVIRIRLEVSLTLLKGTPLVLLYIGRRDLGFGVWYPTYRCWKHLQNFGILPT